MASTIRKAANLTRRVGTQIDEAVKVMESGPKEPVPLKKFLADSAPQHIPDVVFSAVEKTNGIIAFHPMYFENIIGGSFYIASFIPGHAVRFSPIGDFPHQIQLKTTPYIGKVFTDGSFVFRPTAEGELHVRTLPGGIVQFDGADNFGRSTGYTVGPTLQDGFSQAFREWQKGMPM